MKIVINKDLLPDTPEGFIRRAGYGFIRDRRSGKESYVRRLTRDHYPRYHVYIAHMGKNAVIDLHLDQKRSSYAGAAAHSAEYEGQVVEKEIERLKSLLKQKQEELEIFGEKSAEQTNKKSLLEKLFHKKK